MIGAAIGVFSLVDSSTPLALVVLLALVMGFFNSLQFSSMNTMAYADIEGRDTSMASTLASSLQQLSMSFGLAVGSLAAGWYLAGLPQTDSLAVTQALHRAFLALAAVTVLSSLSFWSLRPEDGESVSRGAARVAESQAT
jgi:MFS family permease